jgi:hypothetical protein
VVGREERCLRNKAPFDRVDESGEDGKPIQQRLEKVAKSEAGGLESFDGQHMLDVVEVLKRKVLFGDEDLTCGLSKDQSDAWYDGEFDEDVEMGNMSVVAEIRL